MAEQSIYRDIAERTGGDIYIGVVGPVRSGKSTFITRFMQELVLPNMADMHSRERAKDEMPQSAAGATVMTTEPKFVPDEAVTVHLAEGVALRVKMIDCVGYLVKGALGAEENGAARMVSTPWHDHPIPFEEAAEIGTQKVMREHATIGMLVTGDGSVGDIKREAFEEAEERIVAELKALGKPFALILNSADPQSPAAVSLAEQLEQKYAVSVALVNCKSLGAEDIKGILSMVLGEFPVRSVGIRLPKWVKALPEAHALRRSLMENISSLAGGVGKMGEVASSFAKLGDAEGVKAVSTSSMDMGKGRAELSVELQEPLYYSALSELTGHTVRDEGELFSLCRDLSVTGEKYAKVEEALESAEEDGYGIVMPTVGDLKLEKPSIVKRSGGYGVRLHAAAPSYHIIRADIETDINPVIGTEEQTEEVLHHVLEEFEGDPRKLWESNLFGKSLYELVGEGLRSKLAHMPEDARKKLSETLERIINEGSNGLICILL